MDRETSDQKPGSFGKPDTDNWTGAVIRHRISGTDEFCIDSIAGYGVKFGSGLQLGIVTVVLADVVDYGEYKFGTRNESVTFSIQTL